MIRKLSLLMLSVTFSLVAARAETNLGLVDFGIKAGITAQNVRFSNASQGDFSLSTDPKMGYHFGLISRVNLLLFHIQPEIIYSHTGYNLTAAGSGSGQSSSSKVRINTLDVPVLAGLRMLWFRFQAGPMFNVMSEGSVSDRADVTDVTVNKPAVSYLLGVGFDIGKLNLDVRYNGQLKRTEQSIQFGDLGINDYRSRMNSWMFSVGLLF